MHRQHYSPPEQTRPAGGRSFFPLFPHILATEKGPAGGAGRQGDGAMQEHIRERVLTLSNYIIESGATVRQTASRYGISKSTVHIEVIIGNASFG